MANQTTDENSSLTGASVAQATDSDYVKNPFARIISTHIANSPSLPPFPRLATMPNRITKAPALTSPPAISASTPHTYDLSKKAFGGSTHTSATITTNAATEPAGGAVIQHSVVASTTKVPINPSPPTAQETGLSVPNSGSEAPYAPIALQTQEKNATVHKSKKASPADVNLAVPFKPQAAKTMAPSMVSSSSTGIACTQESPIASTPSATSPASKVPAAAAATVTLSLRAKDGGAPLIFTLPAEAKAVIESGLKKLQSEAEGALKREKDALDQLTEKTVQLLAAQTERLAEQEQAETLKRKFDELDASATQDKVKIQKLEAQIASETTVATKLGEEADQLCEQVKALEETNKCLKWLSSEQKKKIDALLRQIRELEHLMRVHFGSPAERAMKEQQEKETKQRMSEMETTIRRLQSELKLTVGERDRAKRIIAAMNPIKVEED